MEQQNKKITEYKIIGDTIFCFESEVNIFIKEGWQLYGNPFVMSNRYCQAMVKYEDKN